MTKQPPKPPRPGLEHPFFDFREQAGRKDAAAFAVRLSAVHALMTPDRPFSPDDHYHAALTHMNGLMSNQLRGASDERARRHAIDQVRTLVREAVAKHHEKSAKGITVEVSTADVAGMRAKILAVKPGIDPDGPEFRARQRVEFDTHVYRQFTPDKAHVRAYRQKLTDMVIKTLRANTSKASGDIIDAMQANYKLHAHLLDTLGLFVARGFLTASNTLKRDRDIYP